jgi:hypothetical protein
LPAGRRRVRVISSARLRKREAMPPSTCTWSSSTSLRALVGPSSGLTVPCVSVRTSAARPPALYPISLQYRANPSRMSNPSGANGPLSGSMTRSARAPGPTRAARRALRQPRPEQTSPRAGEASSPHSPPLRVACPCSASSPVSPGISALGMLPCGLLRRKACRAGQRMPRPFAQGGRRSALSAQVRDELASPSPREADPPRQMRQA